MSDPNQGSSRKDSFFKPGPSAPGVAENQPKFPPKSRLSFMLNAMSDSDPSSETSHSISFVLNTSSVSHIPSNAFLSKPGSSSRSNFDTSTRLHFSEPSHNSLSVPKQEPQGLTSSFLAFSMSHTSASQASREMLLVPKSRGSVVSTLQSPSTTGWETRDSLPTSRLAPHRASCQSFPASDQIQKHILSFNISKEQLQYVKDSILEALERGLKHRYQGGTSLPMTPTYVRAFPDGTERGNFLTLEMSQTHVKVLLLQLTDEENHQTVLGPKLFAISDDMNRVQANQLFEFLAQCLVTFLDGLESKEKYYPLGFSFPFYCQHMSLSQCMLIKSTKEFRWPGVMGNDLAFQLQTAINQQCKNYQIEVVAVVNDTVGLMMSCCSEGEPCEMGLMIDAGTNCCYMEEAQFIVGIEENEGCMCINTEWGAFGNAGELDDLLTEFDVSMDKQSMDPGRNRFEKLIGSLYLCDTVRVFLAQLAEKGELFNGVLTPTLLKKGSLELQDIVDIIDEKEGLSKTKNFLLRLGMVASNQDCFHMQQICQAVFVRSASLCGAGLAALLTHIRKVQQLPQLKMAVAVDGVLFKSNKQYSEILHETLKSLAPKCTVTFVPSDGNSAVGVAMMTAAALRLRTQQQQVAEVLGPFRLSMSDLERLRNLMRLEMEKGLSKDTHELSSVRMLPTFVRSLPNGTERGNFLALDLGGTNFRVLLVQVKSPEEGGVIMTSEIYTIPPEVAQSNAVELFDHIVQCIMDFQQKHNMVGCLLPLGFTFSFPCSQVNLDKGILLAWTKGFSASGCVGEDAVQLLREAMQRKQNSDVDVVAIVNDTVGTMMSCAYEDPKCEIGLIVGTGCNACYMEEMKNVDAVEGDEGQMCINMEWGAFGDNGCLEAFITPFDQQVDAKSLNVGQQRFEKLISGMYLGEIVRYILLELSSRKVLFQGRESYVLQIKDIFPTKFLSAIEEDIPGHHHVRIILEEYKLNVTSEDSIVVKEVCRTVSARAAKVCGAGMAAVVDKIRENRQLDKLEVTVGVDGTLYKVHPTFAKTLQETVAALAPKCKVKFLLSEDGSGKGAALIAAVATRK